jgi:hypothetical protein
MTKKIIALGDERYVFDDQSLTLADAFAIKSASGLDLVPFQNGLNTMSPLSLQTLIWWLRQKNGRPEDIRTIDFKIADLRVDEIEDDEPDPTGSGSEPDETSTSDSSPTTVT